MRGISGDVRRLKLKALRASPAGSPAGAGQEAAPFSLPSPPFSMFEYLRVEIYRLRAKLLISLFKIFTLLLLPSVPSRRAAAGCSL